MLQNYTIINEVDDNHLDVFNMYWEKYTATLPALPSRLHNGIDQKAAILNIWLVCIDVQSCKTLKLERTFSHSFVYRLQQKIMSCLPSNSPLLQFPKACEYHFLYAYYFGIEILSFLEDSLINEPTIEALVKGTDYYRLTDAELAPYDHIYKIIKHFYIKAFNPNLHCHTYTKMHTKTMNSIAAQFEIHALLKNGACA